MMLDQLLHRLHGLLARARVLRVDDGGPVQRLQLAVLDNEVRDRVPRPQPYGLTSRPHPGAEAVVLAVGGNRDNPIAVVVEDGRHRLKGLEAGEVALYSNHGQVLKLNKDGGIELTCPGNLVVAADGSVTIRGSSVDIDSEDIRLAGNDREVARKGDPVAGGVIADGSEKVRAG